MQMYKIALSHKSHAQTGFIQYFSFFAGTRFWVYTGKNVMGPRSIEKLGLPNSIQKVEGALQRGKGKVLLFSGENFWR